ncbi:hypothetical protein AYI68_g5034 [Smittium mucronatum]|uniref:Uncharacterized protein n=1 Tax=Smittium mucronatum TaxID=133383 RepID=A0A1R0GVE3_9FUNG|nr:hypothetical protein AYI68_g5034 [Smittium mucronatum]
MEKERDSNDRTEVASDRENEEMEILKSSTETLSDSVVISDGNTVNIKKTYEEILKLKEEKEEESLENEDFFDEPKNETYDTIPQDKKNEKRIAERSKSNSILGSPFIYISHIFRAINFKGILVTSLTTIGLPFISGIMVGLGEIFANEVMFHYGWRGATPIRIIGNLKEIKKQ